MMLAPGISHGNGALLTQQRDGGDATRRTAAGDQLAWRLFILLNATLFLRPSDLIESLASWHIYELLIIGCFAGSFSSVWRQLAKPALIRAPITACVVGLLGAVVLSHLSQFRVYEAKASAAEFVKVVLYYLLVVGLVNTPERLTSFLRWIAIFAIALTTLSILQYRGLINLSAVSPLLQRQEDQIDPQTGQPLVLARLSGAGIFDNPNDMARLLVLAAGICLYFVGDRSRGFVRMAWAIALAGVVYALHLTASRGGLLGLFGLLGALCWDKWGWRRSAVIGAALVPVFVVVFAGRQMAMDLESGTGQQRIQLWSEGFSLFISHPVFGIGMNEYVQNVGLAAHNSFIHAYVELGFVGGTLFLGAHYLAGWQLLEPGKQTLAGAAPEFLRLRGYTFATVVSAGVGMLSSTRTYSLPTYLLLGLATAYLCMVKRIDESQQPRLDARLVRRVGSISCVLLAAFYLYMRIAVRW